MPRSAEEVRFWKLFGEAKPPGLTWEAVARELNYSDASSLRRLRAGGRRPDRQVIVHTETIFGLAPGTLTGPFDALPRQRASELDGEEPCPPGASAEDVSAESSASDLPADSADKPTGPAGPGTPAPEQAAEPTPDTPQTSAAISHSRREIAAVLIAVALMVLTGWIAGHRARDGADNQAVSSVGVDAVVDVPDGWRSALYHPRANELGLTRPTVMTAVEPAGAGIIFGIARTTGRTLLPTGLRTETARDVRLGALSAYRYESPGADDSLTIFVAPTSLGTITLACFSRSEDTARYAPECERIARTLRLRRGTPYPLGPLPRYAIALDRLIIRLNMRVDIQRRRLGKARSAPAEASKAKDLAAVFADAAHAARQFSVSPADKPQHAEITKALDRESSAYGALGRAASLRQSVTYKHAAAGVLAAERELRQAIRALGQDNGYAVAPPVP